MIEISARRLIKDSKELVFSKKYFCKVQSNEYEGKVYCFKVKKSQAYTLVGRIQRKKSKNDPAVEMIYACGADEPFPPSLQWFVGEMLARLNNVPVWDSDDAIRLIGVKPGLKDKGECDSLIQHMLEEQPDEYLEYKPTLILDRPLAIN